MNQMNENTMHKIEEAMNSKDRHERIKTIRAIARSKEIQRDVVAGVLAEALRDKHYSVRSTAVAAFGEIASQKEALKIIPLLKDKHYEVRYVAAETLGLLKNKTAVPDLIEALRDKDEVVRINAAESLGILKAKKAMKPLSRLLHDPDELVRAYAAEALGEIHDRQAIPILEKMLKTETRNATKLRILESLFKLGDKARLQGIVKMLNAKSYKVRCATTHILEEIVDGASCSDVVTALKSQLQKEPTVAARSTIIASIKNIQKRWKIKPQAPRKSV